MKELKKPRRPRVEYPLAATVEHSNEELLALSEVAALLKISKEAVRKALYRASGPDELPAVLRRCLVTLSPRHRYIAGALFRAWLRKRVSEDLRRNGNENIPLAVSA